MSDLTISIFGNKILFEIIKELNLFPDSRIENLDNPDSYILTKSNNNKNIIFFFMTDSNKKDFVKMKDMKTPIFIIDSSSVEDNKFLDSWVEKINIPFKVVDFKTKVLSFLAKYNFKLSSLIHLQNYIIDKNERKIKKDGIELQMTEKETNFLVLFSKFSKPLSKNFVLKNVWNYSSESDTHTVETHIHRLRKKILEKFSDNNFIKNNKNGYYI
jgi:hypothetical protein|tara:strand:+ start:163 stop:804 length:642 start_codon:yes stop_codon:yes gene_type:complete